MLDFQEINEDKKIYFFVITEQTDMFFVFSNTLIVINVNCNNMT